MSTRVKTNDGIIGHLFQTDAAHEYFGIGKFRELSGWGAVLFIKFVLQAHRTIVAVRGWNR
jgi:hypothetical protein